MLERLRRWAQRAGNPPTDGYACVYEDMPFRYSSQLPNSRTLVPGVICVHLGTGVVRIASGGDSENGAEYWRRQNAEVAA